MRTFNFVRVADACKALLRKNEHGACLLSVLENKWKELHPEKTAPGGQVIPSSSLKEVLRIQQNCLAMHVLGRVCFKRLDAVPLSRMMSLTLPTSTGAVTSARSLRSGLNAIFTVPNKFSMGLPCEALRVSSCHVTHMCGRIHVCTLHRTWGQ